MSDDPELQTFKDNVKAWLSIDDKVVELQQQIKGFKAQQKELSTFIMHFMGERDINEISSNEGNLRFNTLKTKAGLSNKKLKSTISAYFENDQEKTDALIEHIMSNREVKETLKLKRYG